MEELMLQKKQLRKEIAARVKATTAAYRAQASEAIQDAVLSSEAYRAAQRVLLYLHMPTEPDTDRIIRQALADGKAVYVPKCVSKTEMIAVRIRNMSDLAPGAYGIPEPVDCSEVAEPSELDLIVVPCVAASKDGRRLGHGAGFYDRYLAGSAARRLCLCRSRNLLEAVPAEAHDVRMEWVVTEEGTFFTGKA